MPEGIPNKMIKSRLLQIQLAALALIECASAHPVTSTEHLNAEIPEGWVQVLNSKTENLSLAEYLPSDHAIPWHEKLSIEAMSDPYLPDPYVFVSGWSQDQQRLCDDYTDTAIFSGHENGYPVIVRMLICGKNKRTGKPLVTMLKVIRGNQSLYTITRIWRVEQLPLPEQTIAGWSRALKKTIVCDPERPAHPCP